MLTIILFFYKSVRRKRRKTEEKEMLRLKNTLDTKEKRSSYFLKKIISMKSYSFQKQGKTSMKH